MFDTNIYASILHAVFDILRNNQNQLGRDFCERFMTDYDTSNGQQTQANAQHLFDFVVSSTQRMNGNMTIRDNDQLFQIVGQYVQEVFKLYNQRMNTNRGGFGQSQGFGFGNFGGNGGFGGGGGSGTMFGRSGFGNSGGGFGGGFQTRPAAGQHMVDDTARMPTPPPTPAPAATASPLDFSQSATTTATAPLNISTKYVDNPLDDIGESVSDFHAVPRQPNWGDDKPKDRRIVVAKRDDIKTRDQKYTIGDFSAFHQIIQNDPMAVVRDFFDVVPDATLSHPFMFRINYNHLEVIDVPSSDFLEIRQRCADALAHDRNAQIHRQVIEVLTNMKRGPWKAMTSYLTRHINNALWHALRLSEKPHTFIRISEFDDLDELLSSSFTHSFTNHPEGRYRMEQIVGAAIWNAIGHNSDLMFTGSDIPTAAIQSSPAFPYSMEGVYPNKFAIPTSNEELAETFLEHMKSNELDRRSYVLSKRMVTITNILGKRVLPNLTATPKVITNGVAALLNNCAISYTKNDVALLSTVNDVRPYVSEEYPSVQLEADYADPGASEEAEIENFGRIKPSALPVDHHIFAIQSGMSPQEYLMGIDVFTTIDNGQPAGSAILAKKTLPSITTNA